MNRTESIDSSATRGRSVRPLDTTAVVVTPEKIAFEYPLSGPFRRLPAFGIDLIVRGVLLIVVGLTLTLISFTVSVAWINSYLIALLWIGWFALSFFYGAFCESVFNGRTVGKAVCGIRVIGVDGRPISGFSAILRNLLRAADALPMAPLFFVENPSLAMQSIVPTAMVGFGVMMANRRMQRLGDLAAGTMVVVDEPLANLPSDPLGDSGIAINLSNPGNSMNSGNSMNRGNSMNPGNAINSGNAETLRSVAAGIPGDYRVNASMAKVLATYVQRRSYLSVGRREEIASSLTTPLVQQFGLDGNVDGDTLMLALYHRTFHQSEP